MAFWDKFKGGGSAGDGGGDDAFKADPRKARRFFEHAETTADAGNYDYSIECYINGLRHEPETMSKHEALYEVAKRRKVKGGKAAGLGEKMKSIGPRPVDKMLQAEKIWAKDILNVTAMRDFMKAATDADAEDAKMNLGEVVYWIGGLLIDANSNAKRPSKKIFIEARDMFEKVEAYDKAVEACRRAASMDPNNSDLLQDLKQLEASNAMQKGGYNATSADEGGFRNFVRDEGKQRELEQEDAVSKTQSQIDQIIARRRAEYEEEPQDTDRISKFVDALLQKPETEPENEAISLLHEAWEDTGSYRFKMRAGDVKMRQMNREIRELQTQAKENPDNAELIERVNQLRVTRLKFELEEYTERIKNYPTDLAMRYEYGLRLYQTGQTDEAIGAFQQAKADPKRRSVAYLYLGHCYIKKGWLDEAIDTLREGLEKHPLRDDKQGLELQYQLMNALEMTAEKNSDAALANEAREIASTILQTNINFRDIRARTEKIRDLCTKLNG